MGNVFLDFMSKITQFGIWDNVWQVTGALVGVLGTALVVRREIANSNRQHNEQMQQIQRHHDSELLIEHINKISELNYERIEMVKQIRRCIKHTNEIARRESLNLKGWSIDDKTNQDYISILNADYKAFLKNYVTVTTNTLYVIELTTLGHFDEFDNEMQSITAIHNDFLGLDLTKETVDQWEDEILTLFSDTAPMNTQLKSLNLDLNRMLHELVR